MQGAAAALHAMPIQPGVQLTLSCHHPHRMPIRATARCAGSPNWRHIAPRGAMFIYIPSLSGVDATPFSTTPDVTYFLRVVRYCRLPKTVLKRPLPFSSRSGDAVTHCLNLKHICLSCRS